MERISAAPVLTMRKLWRLALWGLTATAALLVAVITGQGDTGSRQVGTILSFFGGSSQPAHPVQTASQAPPRSVESEQVTRQLVQAVRGLAQDRDQLLTRISAVEHSLDDITGSITRQIDATKAEIAAAASSPWPSGESAVPAGAPAAAVGTPILSAPLAVASAFAPIAHGQQLGVVKAAAAPILPQASAPPPATSVPPPAASVPPPAASVPPPAASVPPPAASASSPEAALLASIEAPQPISPPEPASPPATTADAAAPIAPGAYGVDLGHGATMRMLRDRWIGISAAHADLFAGMIPTVVVRDTKPGHSQLRLVVGPLANAAAAAQLCVVLEPFKLGCQPTIFNGQRLALR